MSPRSTRMPSQATETFFQSHRATIPGALDEPSLPTSERLSDGMLLLVLAGVIALGCLATFALIRLVS
jgi:hypothetical protein